ncbi:MAG: hypothetical protein QW512_00385 [Thermofilaceae archaeon]
MAVEINWSVLLCAIIVVCASVGLITGRLDDKDFISCIGLVLSFLSGGVIGYAYARRFK